MGASPGLTARSLVDLDDGPLRAVVAAWGHSARSGIVASEGLGEGRTGRGTGHLAFWSHSSGTQLSKVSDSLGSSEMQSL